MSLHTIRKSPLSSNGLSFFPSVDNLSESRHDKYQKMMSGSGHDVGNRDNDDEQKSVSSTDVNVNAIVDCYDATQFGSTIFYNAQESIDNDNTSAASFGDEDDNIFVGDEEKKDDPTVLLVRQKNDDGLAVDGLTRQRSSRAVADVVEHHPWKKRTSRLRGVGSFGSTDSVSPTRRVRGAFSFPKDDDDCNTSTNATSNNSDNNVCIVPVSPTNSISSNTRTKISSTPIKSLPELPLSSSTTFKTEELSSSSSSSELDCLAVVANTRTREGDQFGPSMDESSTQDMTEFTESFNSISESNGREIWRAELVNRVMATKNELSAVSEHATLSKDDMTLRRKTSSNVEDEWRNLMKDADVVDDIVPSPPSSPSRSPRQSSDVGLSREDSYVRRIVKNVDEHGSPTPGMRKCFPSTAPIEVKEGIVQSIKEDVETWATRSPQYDKKGNLILEIDEGHVKTVTEDLLTKTTKSPSSDERHCVMVDIGDGHVKMVVDDVERRVIEATESFEEMIKIKSTKKLPADIPIIMDEAHTHETSMSTTASLESLVALVEIEDHIVHNTEARGSSNCDEDVNSTQQLTVEYNTTDRAESIGREDHKHETPKTKNTDGNNHSTFVTNEENYAPSSVAIDSKLPQIPADPLLEELQKYRRQSKQDSCPVIDYGVPDTVETTPTLSSRDVIVHSTPMPAFTATHISNVKDTPISVGRSVSFEDALSVKSDLGSMVSNLSYPTYSGGSYMVSGHNNSPRISTCSIGTPRSTGSKTRKKISEMIRRDLWSKDVQIVEAALNELSEQAGLAAQNRHTIARSGGILAIVRAMEQNDSHAGIQIAACRALEKLALETDNELAIGEVGGVDAVLAAMMQHCGDVYVQEAAWSALWNLTCGNACDEMTTDTEGGMHAIVACMKQHVDHPEVQRNACGALANLCLYHDGRLRSLAEADGFVAIATALQNHWDDEGVRFEASNALTSLVEKCLPEPISKDLVPADADSINDEDMTDLLNDKIN